MSKPMAVAYVDEVRPGESKVVAAESLQIALFNVKGTFYATTNVCPHKGGPLGDGCLDEEVVTCPWHDWKFNVVTGENDRSKQVKLQTFAVVSDQYRVWVRI